MRVQLNGSRQAMSDDKTRNMEHSGTSRNIPEHPGTGQIITK